MLVVNAAAGAEGKLAGRPREGAGAALDAGVAAVVPNAAGGAFGDALASEGVERVLKRHEDEQRARKQALGTVPVERARHPAIGYRKKGKQARERGGKGKTDRADPLAQPPERGRQSHTSR